MLGSVGGPLWLRGPGETPVPGPAGSNPGAHRRARRRACGSSLFDGASLGFIRQRVAAGQLPNFGAHARPRRRDRSRHAAADAGRPGVGGGRHRPVPARQRHPLEARCTASATTTPSPVDCCRTTASPTRCVPGLRSRTEALTQHSLRARPLWDILGRLSGSASASSTGRSPRPRRARPGLRDQRRFDEAASVAAAAGRRAGRAIRRRP